MKLHDWALQSAAASRDWREVVRIVSREIGIEPPERITANPEISSDWLCISIVKGHESWNYWCDGVWNHRSHPPAGYPPGNYAFVVR